MIASLRGQLRAVRADSVIVDVGGVGYHVRVPGSLLGELSRIGQPDVQGTRILVELYIHTHVRENEIALYGFRSLEELDLFTLLLGVSGIGPRTAMNMLSALSPETLRSCIAQGDVQMLTHVPGIGRKTAQRLVVDLKDKLGAPEGALAVSSLGAADADVLNALTALGYSVAEATNALVAVPAEVKTPEERILAALRFLGSG